MRRLRCGSAFALIFVVVLKIANAQLLLPLGQNNNNNNLLRQRLQLQLLLSARAQQRTVAVPTQQPIIQTCTVDAACARCEDQSTVIINNGRVVTSNVNRILKGRFDFDDTTTANQDVCCSNCQPIIGDANVQLPNTNNAKCSITCDYSQNDQNIANLLNLGNLGSLSGYNTAVNFNPYYNNLAALSSLAGVSGFSGLAGLGANPLLFDSPINSIAAFNDTVLISDTQ